MTSVTVTLSQFPYPIIVQCEPVVPLVADMSVVLVVDVVVGLVLFLVGGLFVRLNAELGHEARVADALLLEDVLGRVPPVGRLQHGSQEPTITLSLVLRA